jgi:hypothetical protein
MPDLRRQIFESGKTVSRKAASREASRNGSRASSKQTSRQGSRNASRQPSDEEDSGFTSDDTAMRYASCHPFPSPRALFFSVCIPSYIHMPPLPWRDDVTTNDVGNFIKQRH